MVGHYWGSFSCSVCLAFTTHTAAGMKAHLIGCGQYGMEHAPKHNLHARKPIKVPNPAASSKGKKSKEEDSGMKGNE